MIYLDKGLGNQYLNIYHTDQDDKAEMKNYHARLQGPEIKIRKSRAWEVSGSSHLKRPLNLPNALHAIEILWANFCGKRFRDNS